MQAAVRSYKTMGVALVGAGVIAVSPLAPPMPHVQAVQRAVSSAGVELDALVNPIERWVQVLSAAGANLNTIAQAIIDNPTPILTQVIANQTAYAQAFNASAQAQIQQMQSILQSAPANLQLAWAQVQAGNLVTNGTDKYGNLISTGALNIVNDQIVAPLVLAGLTIATDALIPAVNTAQEFANAMGTIIMDTPPYDAAVLTAGLPFVLPVVSAMNALAQTTQDVVTAPSVAAAVNALVNAPANLVGAILNGYGEVSGSPAAGILTPWSDAYGEFGSGPIGSLNELRELIAEAIGATPPVAATALAVTPATTAKSYVAANELPAASAKLVALNAASPAKAVGALALTKIAAIAAPAAAKTVTVDPASPAKDVNAVATTATGAAATSAAAAATTATKPSRLNPAKGVSDGIRKASKHAGDGSTTAAAGTGAKSSSTGTGGSKSSAGGSNGGGKHRASK